MTVLSALLRAAALLAPRAGRQEWLEEWRSELWYVRRTRPREAKTFCLGAFSDALWLRRNNARPLYHVRSSLRCVMWLAVLAGMTVIFTSRIAMREQQIFPHLLMLFIALLVLPVVIPLNFSAYPANHRLSNPASRRFFFAIKIVLIVATVFCGSLSLVSTGVWIAGPASLPVYVLAFRWALIDQRRRCPVCLRGLTSPVRIGESSHTFLAWCGTELICTDGHGVLHIPEIPTSCYPTQRWISLERHAGA